MKRRRLIQSLAALPAAGALPAAAAQQSPSSPEPAALTETGAEAAADPVRRFLSQDQLAALVRLGEFVVPPMAGRPGARDAGAAEFLDFLVGQSSPERQKLYRDGLDSLNSEARRTAGKAFSELTLAEAAPLLAPLRGEWSYHGPAQPVAKFLASAKDDLLEATRNSREWADAASRGRRGGQGTGYYWLPLD